MPMPRFIKSEYFVAEVDNWHLKKDAPKEVQEEFDSFMNEREDALKSGRIVD